MTTDLRILGRDYDLEDTTQRVGLNVLVYMAKRLGITLKDIVGGLQQLNAGSDPLDLIADEKGLDAIRGLIWLARTHAGERTPEGKFFTLDDACEGVSLTDLEFADQDGDPKALELEAAGSPSTSTTSNGTSSSTS